VTASTPPGDSDGPRLGALPLADAGAVAARTRKVALRREILGLVRRYAEIDDSPAFVPGVSPVRYAGRVYDHEELTRLVDAALDFELTAGRYADELERGLAARFSARDALLVGSGSSANLIAIASLTSPALGERRLRPGDEVLTVAAGFPTTVTPILQHGLVPVFVDIDVPTYNVDVTRLREAVGPRTRAVMLAHTLGNPFDLDAVTALCREHGLWLVEDNCDANGSLWKGQRTGSFGDLSTLSFYPPHHMTTGEGGAVICKRSKLGKVARSFRDWGRDCWCPAGQDDTCGKRFGWELGALPCGYDHKYTYSHLGYNLKVTDLQAAIGVAQLAKVDGFGAARRANWAALRADLAPLEEWLVLPEPTPGADPSWFGFMVLVREGAPFGRDALVRALETRKIQTRMLFGGNLLRQPAFVDYAEVRRVAGQGQPWRVVGELTQTDRVMQRGLWVGVYPGLQRVMRDAMVTAFHEAIADLLATAPAHRRAS
jgi:CDP-6-deoxy-D-xylo-4-hexulose-3-dehydrase